MTQYYDYDDKNVDDKITLERIKKNISTSYNYFNDNYERFREYRIYVYKECLSEQQRAFLRRLNRPLVEFNILEAYLNRIVGEFIQHEPSISCRPAEGVPVSQDVLNTIDGYYRHLLFDADKDSFSVEIMKEMISGGFSVAEVRTDYENPMSMKQKIFLEKVFDPTLCGFDPMARASHKGDGNYCFEIFPMTEEDFRLEFPNRKIDTIKYTSVQSADELASFTWSYKDIKDKRIILVAKYYEKKKKRVRIVELADGTVMSAKKYKKLQEYWETNAIIEQIPIIKGEPRWTIIDTIVCYKLCQNQILEYYETDYAYLPLVFFDGNSVNLSYGKVNSSYQMTKPLIYHAKGAQDLKNFAGQALANYLMNMVQHKFIIKKEAIVTDADSLEALKNIQKMNNIIVHAYSENNPDKPIPEPIREVQPVPAPPEIMNTFSAADPTTQMILGSFASNLGKPDNDLSGKAVVEIMSAGNSTTMPYYAGYLAALSHIGNIVIDLIPKYILGKRTLPMVDKNKKRSWVEVNTENGIMLDYEPHAIKMEIEAGVSFQVQKNRAVEQIISLMGASEELSSFFNSEEGLKILSRNLTIYGADNLEEAIEKFVQEQKQQQQQAAEMQQQMMQNDPSMIKAQSEMMKAQLQGQEMALKQQQAEFDNQIKIAKQAVEKIIADAKLLEAEAKVTSTQIEGAVRMEEAQTSLETHALDNATKLAEIESRSKKDNLEHMKLAHEVSKHAQEVRNKERESNHDKETTYE